MREKKGQDRGPRRAREVREKAGKEGDSEEQVKKGGLEESLE